MATQTPNASAQTGSEWPAVIVALGILVLLGGVLITATARWTAKDLNDVVTALGPVLGVVSGAFVTYFFTRQANASAVNSARMAHDAAAKEAESMRNQLSQKDRQTSAAVQRAQALHNSLTTVLTALGATNAEVARDMLDDQVVSAALNSHRRPQPPAHDDRPAA